jgi:hypothetical protein
MIAPPFGAPHLRSEYRDGEAVIAPPFGAPQYREVWSGMDRGGEE